MSFVALGLSQPLLRAVGAEGYSVPTPIQSQAIPHVLAGRDLFGCAQTGTGKTAAFALPILHRLSQAAAPTDKRRAIRNLVLAPTRELAAQIGESFRTYGQFTNLRSTVIFGGVGQNPQVHALRGGVDTLVATPGRLLDLMEQRFVSLNAVEILVLDEADQMLDMGFLPSLQRIVSHVPSRRQTLLFSATMPPEIRRMAESWLRNPMEVRVAPAGTPAELVEQTVYHVAPQFKPQLLIEYLRTNPATRALVFTRTKHGADKVVRKLSQAGIRAAAIHGNKSQNQRLRALDSFKSERPPVLVATDIAARGLDISGISHVINYDVPNVPEQYVHRIGRTGRAGANGIAVSLCSREERPWLRQIERLTRNEIQVVEHELTEVGGESFDFAAGRGGDRSSQRPPNGRNSRGGGRRGGRPSGGRPARSGTASNGHSSHTGSNGQTAANGGGTGERPVGTANGSKAPPRHPGSRRRAPSRW